MHGHHRHAVGVLVVIVDVGIQRHLVKKARERAVFRLLAVVDDVRFQLLHVFDARGVLGSVFLLQRTDVAGALQHKVVQLLRRHRLGGGAQLVHQDRKLPQAQAAALQRGVLVRVADDLHQARVLLLCKLRRRLHAARADAARRVVDDARQAQIVLR